MQAGLPDINPHEAGSLAPRQIFRIIVRRRGLILDLARRDVAGRYRGSVLGLLWSFFNPLLMLAVYTFVFSVVFKARWAGGSDSKTEFALVLFAGLIFFNFFSECINRAPVLVIGNANYVKKVVFPLEVLPVVTMASAAFHLLISFCVWLLFYLLFFGIPPITIALLPLVLLPLMLLTLGLSWLLASLGVYLRDVAQVVTVITTVLMFLSPIFYSVSSLPENYRPFLKANPLTLTIEEARSVMIWGVPFEWMPWVGYLLATMLVAWLGFAWFQKTRKGFADVL